MNKEYIEYFETNLKELSSLYKLPILNLEVSSSLNHKLFYNFTAYRLLPQNQLLVLEIYDPQLLSYLNVDENVYYNEDDIHLLNLLKKSLNIQNEINSEHNYITILNKIKSFVLHPIVYSLNFDNEIISLGPLCSIRSEPILNSIYYQNQMHSLTNLEIEKFINNIQTPNLKVLKNKGFNYPTLGLVTDSVLNLQLSPYGFVSQYHDKSLSITYIDGFFLLNDGKLPILRPNETGIPLFINLGRNKVKYVGKLIGFENPIQHKVLINNEIKLLNESEISNELFTLADLFDFRLISNVHYSKLKYCAVIAYDNINNLKLSPVDFDVNLINNDTVTIIDNSENDLKITINNYDLFTLLRPNANGIPVFIENDCSIHFVGRLNSILSLNQYKARL